MSTTPITGMESGRLSTIGPWPVSANPVSANPVSAHPVSAHPVSAKTRLRLTRRGRIVVTTLAAIPVVAAALGLAFTGAGAHASDTASGVHFDYVTVQPGDSLWQIAETVAPSADPRVVISGMVALNRLQGVEVRPGQRIAIPVEYAAEGATAASADGR